MKNNKRGISLIVLIVTIIVIIILAAVVILTLSKNNPVESARKARFMEDVRSFQDELALSVSKDYVTKKENRNEKFNATDFDDMKNYIPSFTKDYKDKFTIQEDELVYNKDNVTENEKKCLDELGIGTKKENFAKKVAEDPKTYYGKYVINYTTDHSETENAVEKWQIFHSDGENIYLIADDYIDGQYAPNGKKGNSIRKNNTNYQLSFDNVYNDYEGSQNIIKDSKAKKWIEWVDSYPNSTNENIRAVAYMLDTSENVWGKYAGSKAKYAIGGPTLEMFVESYNKSHDANLACKEMTDVGYKIGYTHGNYNNYLTGLPNYGIGFNDTLYVIKDISKAEGVWLSSPVCTNVKYYNLMRIYYSSRGTIYVNFLSSKESKLGFRPVVCLKSDISLKASGEDFVIE